MEYTIPELHAQRIKKEHFYSQPNNTVARNNGYQYLTKKALPIFKDPNKKGYLSTSKNCQINSSKIACVNKVF